MESNSIAFIGRSTIDNTYYFKEYPTENTKCFAQNYIKQYGGPALNAAITCSLLGISVDVISCFGNSDSGLQAKQELKKQYNMGVIDALSDESFQMPTSAIMVNTQNASRTIINSPKVSQYQEPNYTAINLSLYKIIMIDGYNYSHELKAKLVEAKNAGSIIVFDGGSWKDDTETLINLVDYAICSSNFTAPDCTRAEMIHFLHKKGVAFIAFTNNDKEVQVSQNGDQLSIPIENINAMDTLGAGDVLHGAFCYYLAQGIKAFDALQLATKIATQSCQYLGTHTWNLSKHD